MLIQALLYIDKAYIDACLNYTLYEYKDLVRVGFRNTYFKHFENS